MTNNSWQKLYRRAINEANGLTNYVEDRPELRSAEKRLDAIEVEARALAVQEKQQPAASGEPVAHVSECEACFTPDACQLRGTCDHYAAEKLRIAAAPQPSPARVPLTDAEIDYLAKSVTTTRPGKIAIEFARAIEAAHGILPQQLKDEK